MGAARVSDTVPPDSKRTSTVSRPARVIASGWTLTVTAILSVVSCATSPSSSSTASWIGLSPVLAIPFSPIRPADGC